MTNLRVFTTHAQSLRERIASHGKGHRSDQGKVWQAVGKQQSALGVASSAAALADSYRANQQRINEVAADFHDPEGAAGLAVAVGHMLMAVDLFEKPAICRKVWRGLLAGFILDAVATPTKKGQVTQAAVEEALANLRHSTWEQVKPVGDGSPSQPISTIARLLLDSSSIPGPLETDTNE